MSSLQNKNIIVTGAGAGIGRAVAIALANQQANVYAISKTSSNLASLKLECPSISTACIDITDIKTVQDYIRCVAPLDGLVNNAAIAVIRPFLDITPDNYDLQMDVNLKANFFVAQAAAKNMIACSKSGSIVNVSSQASQAALRDHSIYGMSKAGIDNLTKNMALELGQHGIRVNSVNPTVVMTDMGRIGWSDPVKAKPMLDKIPLGRFAEVEEIVAPILFLLSESASMINGSMIPIDGGFLAT